MLWPLALGLALCALCLWAGLVYQHNQARFQAHAVPARAVIDRIYTSAPSQNYSASVFDQYALVKFKAQGQTAQARVLLVSDCTGSCSPEYRIGQVITVDYSPANLGYAQLPSRLIKPSASILYAFIVFGFLGVIFISAAVINIVTARRLAI